MASVQSEDQELQNMVVADGDVDRTENNPDVENEDVDMAEDRRVINESETGYYSDLGLGLGVDATDPHPWTNKKSFRARCVTFENLLGIKGGILRAFSDEVKSVRDFQSHMKASVPTSEVLSVGIDAEASRSYTVQKRSVGKKIVSRTIAFKSEFKNIPRFERTETDSGEIQPSFEKRLTGFIEERTKKDVKSLSMDALVDRCFQFVENRAITHYVHSIELGACCYRTMSEEEFAANFGNSTSLGVERIAEIALTNSARVERYNFQDSVIKIGRMKKRDDEQYEEVEAESVVGLKFQLISSLLVNSAKLREAMEKAVRKYITKKGDSKFGPFHIACNGNLFLKVDSHNRLRTTDQLQDASQFSVMRRKRGDEHFNIVYQPPVSENGIPVPSLFLSASKHDAPLLMSDTVSNSKLALRSRFSERFDHPANLSEWININGSEREYFYIICKDVRRTALRKRYYLSVFKPGRSGGNLEEQEYVTGCQHREDHDQPDTHMLFSLIKPHKPKFLEEVEASGDDNQSHLFPTKDKISEEGPFFIAADLGDNKENVYFSVKDCNVHATTEESEASRFYIRYEQGSQFFRVYLHYKTGGSGTIIASQDTKNKLERSCYMTQISGTSMEWCLDPSLHLTAVVNRHGCSINRNHQLQLQHRDSSNSQSQCYSYLSICEQKQSTDSEAVESVNPERWFQAEGNKAFYVRCSAKPDATSGNCSYLCVRRKASHFRRQATHSTGCVPSIKHHNRQGRSMQFKLVRAPESEPKETLAKPKML